MAHSTTATSKREAELQRLEAALAAKSATKPSAPRLKEN